MVGAVVLAAGASTRMGAPKLLLPLGHEPVIRRTVRQVVDSGFDHVLVVTGSLHDRLAEALDGLPVALAENREFATGMGSSFRVGVEHLGEAEAAMFALGDQPFLTAAEYRAILDTWRAGRPLIVGSRFGAITAPPHLFARELFPELAALQHGARSILQRHAARMTVMSFPAEMLFDIDTPEDYERASRRVAGGQ